MTDQKQPTTVRVEQSLIDTFDEAADDAPDWMHVSRADLLRHAIERGIEDWDGEVLDLIPDEMLAKWETQRMDQRVQAEYYVIDKREGWRGRVKSRLNARLAGEHPYHPDGVETLARGYRHELEQLDALAPESSRTVEEDREWLREQLQDYRDAYLAKTTVPTSDPFDGVDDKVSVGRDLLQLRTELGDLVRDIEERARSEAYDPDAIIRSLAAEYAVEEAAIETVLDELVPERVDVRQALKGLEADDAGVEDVLPEGVVEEQRLDSPREDVDMVPASQMDGSSSYSDHSNTLRFKLDESEQGDVAEDVLDADVVDERDPDIDEAALADALDLDIPDEALDGGETADD